MYQSYKKISFTGNNFHSVVATARAFMSKNKTYKIKLQPSQNENIIQTYEYK